MTSFPGKFKSWLVTGPRYEPALLLTFLVVCSVGVLLIQDLHRSHETARRNYGDAIRGLELLGQLQYQMQEARRIVLYALATTDSNHQVAYADQSRAAEAQAAESLAEAEKLATSVVEVKAVKDLKTSWQAYLKIRDERISSTLKGSLKQAVRRDLEDGIPAFNAVRDDLKVIEGLFHVKADRLLREVDVSFRQSLVRLVMILCLTLALATAGVKVIEKGSRLSALTASETQLRQSHQKFETLVNSIDGVVWEADPATWQFTFVSQQARRLLGFRLEDWLNTPEFWLKHLYLEDRDFAVACRRNAVAARKPFSLDYRLVAADGRTVWIRESAAVVSEAEAPVLRGVLLDITEQKLAEQKLNELHGELLETSRRAGMAEVATGVLHNVGNVLNSVNVGAILLRDRLRESKIQNLVKTASLLREHADDLPRFLLKNPKGKLLPEYFIKMFEQLGRERDKLLREAEHLTENVSHVRDIVATQQDYAKVAGLVETLPVTGLIEDAVRIHAGGFSRHDIHLIRDFQDGVPAVAVDRHKVLQILVNLASNAIHALEASSCSHREIRVGVTRKGEELVKITFQDNGVGIPPENLTRIFSHGFTTKPKGHGFGLHSAAIAAKEMGGSLAAHSEGWSHGALFTLELPIAGKEH